MEMIVTASKIAQGRPDLNYLRVSVSGCRLKGLNLKKKKLSSKGAKKLQGLLSVNTDWILINKSQNKFSANQEEQFPAFARWAVRVTMTKIITVDISAKTADFIFRASRYSHHSAQK